MDPILVEIRHTGAYQRAIGSIRAHNPAGPLGLPHAARLAFVAALQQDLSCDVLLLTDRDDHALALWEELSFWTQTLRLHCAEPNPLFYERAPWSATVRRERLQALMALAASWLNDAPRVHEPAIVIASARALMTRTIPLEEFLAACHPLTTGSRLPPNLTRHGLASQGYTRNNVVLEPGQFAIRGGILDVWAQAAPWPVRLELVGDEIESIRTFDPISQRTVDVIQSIQLTPAREFLLPEGDRSPETVHPGSEPSESDIATFHPSSATLLDYLGSNALVLIDDLSAIDGMMEEIEHQAVDLRSTVLEDGILPPAYPMPYVPWSELRDQLQTLSHLTLGRDDDTAEGSNGVADELAAVFGHDQRFGGRLKPFMDYLGNLAQKSETALVVSRQCARLEELWKETKEAGGSLKNTDSLQEPAFVEASLREGFVLSRLHLITDSEIFGWERPAARPRLRTTAETPESVYSDLKPGDYVVHVDHGIARYGGLVQRNLDGREREYLALEYNSGGQLFVPVHQADRLTRYVGDEGLEPSLDRLGGQEWRESKARAQGAVIRVAQEMLELHARREVAQGHAFGRDTPWQAELEASFPYVETNDQVGALQEIKRDMERDRPMDRLLCGDVGYGKTELALRAAFKAVMGGKQVAVLVPTTVLAQQHWETFQQRLAAFPVKVEMLSRFRSVRQQGEILVALARGEVDIVIGTHRLLSADVEFKELGLVVIDEEQRFGVSHKEHLMRLRTEADVLTLTATPIPRTLYMALTGVRDISNLNTPPEERLPIVTHVGPYSPRLARQAILRELERGGQIFFVHNRVNTIDAMRTHLGQLVPEARVDVGHGQMPEHQLEQVMHRFNRGMTDVLLSTTIIESGLDIPNANTLIVDRADTFGLAQLYQLRGRVGRGAARAYAYFFRHRRRMPTLDAQQRLDVIAENTELGAGYSIAMRDLEIRGAGELLGSQQHGHIRALGFHLYTRLLADAVRQLRRRALGPGEALNGAPAAPPALIELGQPVPLPVTVDLPLAVGIPSEYIIDTDLRLRLYRRIADLRDGAEIDALSGEFEDRFGPLPEMVQSLFYQMKVKLLAEKAGLSSVAWESGQFVLRFVRSGNGRSGKKLEDLGPSVRGGRGAYWCTFPKDMDWRTELLRILHII
jgi:transcription-repair coupling factor (superfamily II helicase)